MGNPMPTQDAVHEEEQGLNEIIVQAEKERAKQVIASTMKRVTEICDSLKDAVGTHSAVLSSELKFLESATSVSRVEIGILQHFYEQTASFWSDVATNFNGILHQLENALETATDPASYAGLQSAVGRVSTPMTHSELTGDRSSGELELGEGWRLIIDEAGVLTMSCTDGRTYEGLMQPLDPGAPSEVEGNDTNTGRVTNGAGGIFLGHATGKRNA